MTDLDDYIICHRVCTRSLCPSSSLLPFPFPQTRERVSFWFCSRSFNGRKFIFNWWSAMSTPSPELQSTPDRPEPHPYLHEPVLWITSLPPYVTDENLAAAFATCVPFRPNIVRDSSNKLLSGTIEFKYLERGQSFPAHYISDDSDVICSLQPKRLSPLSRLDPSRAFCHPFPSSCPPTHQQTRLHPSHHPLPSLVS
jgi:hypothetical protein